MLSGTSLSRVATIFLAGSIWLTEISAGVQVQTSNSQPLDRGASSDTQTVTGRVFLTPGLNSQDVNLVLRLSDKTVLKGFVRLDGSFSFRHVPKGLHLLEVHHPGFLFPQVRLEVSDSVLEQHVRASYVGGDNRLLPYPLIVKPMVKVSYFEPRQGFSWRSFLFQPQIIMMLVMIGGLFILPKMALDPEQLKEMQAMTQGAGSSAQPSAQGRQPQQQRPRR
mmetsp:Transcript_23576/g.56373  ORF Transcript_23576/g.56373 Transcript_23576/m.56373 type:complete len:221 (-) Transcript_23576:478-1140(-)